MPCAAARYQILLFLRPPLRFGRPPSLFSPFSSAGSRDRSHSETNPTNSDAATPRTGKKLVIESTIIVRHPSAFSIYARAAVCVLVAHPRKGSLSHHRFHGVSSSFLPNFHAFAFIWVNVVITATISREICIGIYTDGVLWFGRG